MKVYLREITILDRFTTFQLNLIGIDLEIQKLSIKLQLGRFQIFDLIKTSKYKYILDQESIYDYSVQDDKDQHFGVIVVNFNNETTTIHADIKPVRVCLSGALLEYGLHELETFKQTSSLNYDFEVI